MPPASPPPSPAVPSRAATRHRPPLQGLQFANISVISNQSCAASTCTTRIHMPSIPPAATYEGLTEFVHAACIRGSNCTRACISPRRSQPGELGAPCGRLPQAALQVHALGRLRPCRQLAFDLHGHGPCTLRTEQRNRQEAAGIGTDVSGYRFDQTRQHAGQLAKSNAREEWLVLRRPRLTVHRGKCAAPSSFSRTAHVHAKTLCLCTAAAVVASSTACSRLVKQLPDTHAA